MDKEGATMFAAVLAAIAAVTSAVMSSHSNRSLAQLQQSYAREKESTEFTKEQLFKLYYPASINLRASGHLFDRYLEKTTTDEEKIVIEHALKDYNDQVLGLLKDHAVYLASDAPKEVTTDLLDHLVQWTTVYEMKYTHKTYDGPVFAGISEFGYTGFPKGRHIYFNPETNEEGIDGYFNDKTKELRDKLYAAYRERAED